MCGRARGRGGVLAARCLHVPPLRQLCSPLARSGNSVPRMRSLAPVAAVTAVRSLSRDPSVSGDASPLALIMLPYLAAQSQATYQNASGHGLSVFQPPTRLIARVSSAGAHASPGQRRCPSRRKHKGHPVTSTKSANIPHQCLSLYTPTRSCSGLAPESGRRAR